MKKTFVNSEVEFVYSDMVDVLTSSIEGEDTIVTPDVNIIPFGGNSGWRI